MKNCDRYIMILGAGLMQRSAVEACAELGFKSLVVDANPNALCTRFADVFVPVDLKDRESLLALAKKYKSKLQGVFTCGTDFSSSVSYIAEKLSLPSHTFDSSMNATDKVLMRKCFRENSVSSPDFIQIHRNELVSFLTEDKIKKIKFPKVVKPVDNMGARGCRLIRNAGEFIPSVENAILCSRSQRAILEDYMKGSEYSIDAVVYNGTVTICGFADRHIFFPPYFIETGHTMPSCCDTKTKEALINTFVDGIKSLGLTCGVAKADIKFTEKGPMIGEIAGRLSGGYMSGWTFPYSADFNLTKTAMQIACGMEPAELLTQRVKLNIKNKYFKIYEITSKKVSAERAYISIPGKISKIYGEEKAVSLPFIKDLFPRVKVLDTVTFPRNNVEKCGNFISQSTSYECAVKAAEDAVSRIVIRLKPKNAVTERFFNDESLDWEKNFPPKAYELDLEKIISAPDFKAKIPVGTKTVDLIPLSLVKKADNLKDYNHRTVKQTLEMFDAICPEHKELDSREFWKYLIKGGIQGIFYYADSL